MLLKAGKNRFSPKLIPLKKNSDKNRGRFLSLTRYYPQACPPGMRSLGIAPNQ